MFWLEEDIPVQGHLSVIRNCSFRGKKQSSPDRVLKRMKKRIKDESLRKDDEAWLIVDVDSWPDKSLNALFDWSAGDGRYNVAVSNPKFEYWLILHFEDGKKIRSTADCDNRLKKYLSGYNKGFDHRKVSRKQIEEAVRRAKKKDGNRSGKWPTTNGSTVYRLVEKILASVKRG